MAEPDRGRARVADDAGPRAQRQRGHRDEVLRRRPRGLSLQSQTLLRLEDGVEVTPFLSCDQFSTMNIPEYNEKLLSCDGERSVSITIFFLSRKIISIKSQFRSSSSLA